MGGRSDFYFGPECSQKSGRSRKSADLERRQAGLQAPRGHSLAVTLGNLPSPSLSLFFPKWKFLLLERVCEIIHQPSCTEVGLASQSQGSRL